MVQQARFVTARTSGRRVAAVLAATLLAIAACSQDSDPVTGSGVGAGMSGSGLTISPVVQIDAAANEVAPVTEADALDPAGDGTAQCPPTSIAMAGALSGPEAALGVNVRDGAQLAVDEHNRANPGCPITLKTFDTEGAPERATQIAPQIVGDESVLGLIGPAFSGEAAATGAMFHRAGLVSVTASATNPSLTDRGWRTFFRGLANDDVQGPAAANYLTKSLNRSAVCVVEDDTEYGSGLGQAVFDALGTANAPDCRIDVGKGEREFSAVVEQVRAADPDAVFYAGYFPEAAPLVQQLRAALPEVTFVSGDATNDPEFTVQAGSASTGTILSCPCGPAPQEFREAYADAFKTEPGVYSVEAYDIAAILMRGIIEGNDTREALLEFVSGYRGNGLARSYEWSPTGELRSSLIWMYEVTDD